LIYWFIKLFFYSYNLLKFKKNINCIFILYIYINLYNFNIIKKKLIKNNNNNKK